MKITALMPARNESWVIGASLRIVLEWADAAVVLLHASTDETKDIVNQIKAETGRVTVLEENDTTWREMRQRHRLLEAARSGGATHMAITDADEILTANLAGTIRDQIRSLPPGACLHVGMPCLWRSLDMYRVGRSVWANRRDLVLAFRDHPSLCWREVNGYDHHNRAPQASRLGVVSSAPGGVMHLQFASWRRLTAKHAHYKMMERAKYPKKSIAEIDRMYSLALDESWLQVATVPKEWWTGWEKYRSLIDTDAEPWHEAACRALWSQHGPRAFDGLNLFGVCEECQPASAIPA